MTHLELPGIGFIGLGTMGLVMARNLINGGYRVSGFDESPAAVRAHVDNGGIGTTCASDTASNAEVVITMLPKGSTVRNVIIGEGGVAKAASPQTLFVDMSTIHPLDCDAIRKDLLNRNFRMIDAPVGRTSVEAAAGKSLFMVGAEKSDLEQVQPILECMGDTVVDCGGPGMGVRMKIVNNLMTTALNVLTAEVLIFSDAVGLDRDLAIDVMRGTAAVKSHMTTTYQKKVLKNDLSPAFMIDLARKDLDIALRFAEDLEIPLKLARESDIFYSQAQEEGRGRQDWTAIFAMLRDKYGSTRNL